MEDNVGKFIPSEKASTPLATWMFFYAAYPCSTLRSNVFTTNAQEAMYFALLIVRLLSPTHGQKINNQAMYFTTFHLVHHTV